MADAAQFAGKVALVTGAASGIGEACAQAFAARGAQVVIADLKADAAERARDGISATGGTAAAVAGDVADPDTGGGAPEPGVL